MHAAAELAQLVDHARRADVAAGTLGPAGGRYAEAGFVGLLLPVVDELIHHSAEVGVVRDLYAHRS